MAKHFDYRAMKRIRFVGTILLAGAILALDSWTPKGLATWVLQVMVVWASTGWITRGELIALSFTGALFIFLGFAVSPSVNLPMWIGLTNCVLGSLTILLIVLVHLKRAAAEEAYRSSSIALDEARSRAHILSGLLPICSSCKKIRDKAGNWEQMEVYITRHSEASFTHDLCPECMRKLYPGFPGN